MQKDRIKTILNSIFKDIFKENVEISDSTTANDIATWDSLNHIILIKRIEDEFKIQFDLFDMIELKNVGDIINYIQSKISQ